MVTVRLVAVCYCSIVAKQFDQAEELIVLVFDMKVTTEDGCFVLDEVQILLWKVRPPSSVGFGLGFCLAVTCLHFKIQVCLLATNC